MVTIAVTGGIGAGKSTVARMLGDLGAVVIDSDRLAREVVAPGSEGLAAIAAEFGRSVLDPDGSLNRAALARVVFTDASARHRLEQITHPRVRALFEQRRAAAGDDAIVVNDIPLLRTAADTDPFDLVVTVAAPEPVRIGRLVTRGLSEGDARARIAAQISDDERRTLTDVWIDNDGDDAALRRQVRRVWEERILPLARGTSDS